MILNHDTKNLTELEIERLKNQILVKEISCLEIEIRKCLEYIRQNESVPAGVEFTINHIKNRLDRIAKDFS